MIGVQLPWVVGAVSEAGNPERDDRRTVGRAPVKWFKIVALQQHGDSAGTASPNPIRVAKQNSLVIIDIEMQQISILWCSCGMAGRACRRMISRIQTPQTGLRTITLRILTQGTNQARSASRPWGQGPLFSRCLPSVATQRHRVQDSMDK